MIMSSDDRPKNYENSSSYRRPNEAADDQQNQLLGVTNGCLKGNLTLITGLSIAFTLWKKVLSQSIFQTPSKKWVQDFASVLHCHPFRT